MGARLTIPEIPEGSRWSLIGHIKGYKSRYRCSCGAEKVVDRFNVRHGLSRSCGCLKDEEAVARETKHGMSQSKIYRLWRGMVNRCYTPTVRCYPNYGGRGIRVCDRWLNSFEAFFEDMGHKPEGYSIDRIDNNGHYEPSNCRWVSQKNQCNNTRKNVILEINGERKTAQQWADSVGIDGGCVRERLKRGWSAEEAVSPRLLRGSQTRLNTPVL